MPKGIKYLTKSWKENIGKANSISLKGKHCSPETEFKKGHIFSRGKKNHTYIDGHTMVQHYCIDCNKEICYGSIRCKDCYHKNRIVRFQNFCIDCEREITYEAKRCYNCANKIIGKIISEKFRGKNNANYIDGRSEKIYSYEFRKLREKIRQRDNYKCQLCGCLEIECYRKLDVHHIDYNKENNKEKNLISLCQECNLKANFNRDYYYAYFKYIMKENNYGYTK